MMFLPRKNFNHRNGNSQAILNAWVGIHKDHYLGMGASLQKLTRLIKISLL